MRTQLNTNMTYYHLTSAACNIGAVHLIRMIATISYSVAYRVISNT